MCVCVIIDLPSKTIAKIYWCTCVLIIKYVSSYFSYSLMIDLPFKRKTENKNTILYYLLHELTRVDRQSYELIYIQLRNIINSTTDNVAKFALQQLNNARKEI